jgi:hypothetical protein
VKPSLGLLAAFAFLTMTASLSVAAETSGSRATAELSLSASEVRGTTQFLPDGIRGGIMAAPQDFLRLVARVLDEPALFFLLVDKKHLLDSTYEPADLVSLRAYSFNV